MAVDNKLVALRAPQPGSREEILWFITGLHWHLALGGELQPRQLVLIQQAKSDSQFAATVRSEIQRKVEAEVIVAEMAQKLEAAIFGQASDKIA